MAFVRPQALGRGREEGWKREEREREFLWFMPLSCGSSSQFWEFHYEVGEGGGAIREGGGGPTAREDPCQTVDV